MSNKYFTGVGSRKTPKEHQYFLRTFAKIFGWDYILRSGGAIGADEAFENGAIDEGLEYIVYLHNDLGTNFALIDNEFYFGQNPETWNEAMQIASKIHPKWVACGKTARELHARNIYQVLGHDLKTPSEFLLCYAIPKEGSVSGGTRTAWECAKRNGIPVYNTFNSKICITKVHDELLEQMNETGVVNVFEFLEEYFHHEEDLGIFS